MKTYSYSPSLFATEKHLDSSPNVLCVLPVVHFLLTHRLIFISLLVAYYLLFKKINAQLDLGVFSDVRNAGKLQN